MLFSVQDARRVMDDSIRNNQHLIANTPFDLNAPNVIVVIDALIQNTVTSVLVAVYTAALTESRHCKCVLTRGDPTVRRVFGWYNIDDNQIKSVYETISVRVPGIIRQLGYKLVQEDDIWTISWSTAYAQSQWKLLIIHLRVRRALKKYVRCRMEEWLTPPNGRLYIKARMEFNSTLKPL